MFGSSSISKDFKAEKSIAGPVLLPNGSRIIDTGFIFISAFVLRL